MSRLMSVSMTTDAVIERRKTVSRRINWWEDKNGRRLLKAGDTLTLCRKVQGRKAGEPIERLAEVEVVEVSREPLHWLLSTGPVYLPKWAAKEMEREGFPGLPSDEFVLRYFIEAQRMTEHDIVTRIEWRYLDDCEPCAESARCDGCGRLMCEFAGPEPRACGTTCAGCPCPCGRCIDARDDARMELLCQLERDARATA